jgi:hypothetical protein
MFSSTSVSMTCDQWRRCGSRAKEGIWIRDKAEKSVITSQHGHMTGVGARACRTCEAASTKRGNRAAESPPEDEKNEDDADAPKPLDSGNWDDLCCVDTPSVCREKQQHHFVVTRESEHSQSEKKITRPSPACTSTLAKNPSPIQQKPTHHFHIHRQGRQKHAGQKHKSITAPASPSTPNRR